jgi:hypothetical protein
MFSGHPSTVPRRFTVSVISANYAPWYVTHETLKRRLETGEPVRQVEIKFEALDAMTPFGGCYILIDQDTIHLLKAAGIRSPAEMVGRRLALESDDPSDFTRPLRIVRVLKA